MIIRICMLQIILISWFIHSPAKAYQDTLSVYEAYQMAERNFPALRKNPLHDLQSRLRMQNLETGFLPEISVKGLVTYQSDVVTFPFQLPGQEPLDLPRGRVQTYLDINQIIYDGGLTKVLMELEQRENELNKQEQNISLQQLKEQVLNTYFSILVFRQTEKILINSKDLLQDKLTILHKAFEEGVRDGSGILKLKGEILALEQKLEEVRQRAWGLLERLSILAGEPIDITTDFVVPKDLTVNINIDYLRPELEMLSL